MVPLLEDAGVARLCHTRDLMLIDLAGNVGRVQDAPSFLVSVALDFFPVSSRPQMKWLVPAANTGQLARVGLPGSCVPVRMAGADPAFCIALEEGKVGPSNMDPTCEMGDEHCT